MNKIIYLTIFKKNMSLMMIIYSVFLFLFRFPSFFFSVNINVFSHLKHLKISIDHFKFIIQDENTTEKS